MLVISGGECGLNCFYACVLHFTNHKLNKIFFCVILKTRGLPVPVIALLHGMCFGGGEYNIVQQNVFTVLFECFTISQFLFLSMMF